MGKLETNGIFAEHFLLKEQLATSQVVETWLAEDWRTAGRLVSLRLYAPSIQLDQYTLDQLLNELEARAALKHPHLASPASVGVFEGIPYEVLPFPLSNSLRYHQTTHLSEHQLALLIHQVAEALQHLHQHQPPVIHRQLSTDSLYLQDNGLYQIAAPALSQQMRGVLHQSTGTSPALDTAYAAPELLGPVPVYSEASDVFAFGVCLYELCTGQIPWQRSGGTSLSYDAAIPALPAPYSGILNNLIHACLQPDPNKRPSTATLVEESAYYLQHGNWKPYGAFGEVTAESIVYKPASPLRWLIPLLLLLLAGAAGAYYYWMHQPTEPDAEQAVSAAIPDSTIQAAADSQAISEPVTTAVAPPQTVASTKPVRTQPAAEQPTKKPVAQPAPTAAKPKPVTTRNQTTYPRPTDLNGYLNGLLNTEIPFQAREQWRSAIRAYFTPDAIIQANMNGAPLGNFGVSEFIDILLSTEESNSVIIEKTIKDEESGDIEELNVSIISVK